MDENYIQSLTDKQFAVVYSKILERIKEDPIENFIKAGGFMDFAPTSVQEVILKVTFQKILDPYTPKPIQIEQIDADGKFSIETSYMTEVAIYEFLTDKKYDPEKLAQVKVNKIDLICGRRAGKTVLSAMISIYSAISENWKPFLSKTPFATVLIMSHSREFSDEVLDVIKEFITNSPVLSRLVNGDRKQTQSTMNLAVPFIVGNRIVKSLVQIKVGAASSKTTRGIAACAVLCDEICYWSIDENAKESDYKIMKAVRPALKQFGKHGMLIKLSSPGLKLGVLYDEYKKDRSGGLPATYAVFKAPSWCMNSFVEKSEFEEEYTLDPDAFDVEYRANFADSLSNFISPENIELAILKGVNFQAPTGDRDIRYFAAIDAAFKGDTFTFSLVGVKDNRIMQFVSKGWKGDKRNPVNANEVAAWIQTTIKDFPLEFVAADQFAFQPLKEIFDRYNITLKEYPFTPTFKKKIYFNLKSLVHRNQIDLLDNAVQTKEMKELVVEQGTSGLIKIGHPVGGSDDYSDSLAIAAMLATEGQSTGKFEFESVTASKTYGIKVDSQGRAFTAPSPDMLVQSGHLAEGIFDNSSSYGIDPEDGKFKALHKFIGYQEDDEEGFQVAFG